MYEKNKLYEIFNLQQNVHLYESVLPESVTRINQ